MPVSPVSPTRAALRTAHRRGAALGGGCEDAGEDPVGLVGKGADQLAGAQPPQLGAAVRRARHQETTVCRPSHLLTSVFEYFFTLGELTWYTA